MGRKTYTFMHIPRNKRALYRDTGVYIFLSTCQTGGQFLEKCFLARFLSFMSCFYVCERNRLFLEGIVITIWNVAVQKLFLLERFQWQVNRPYIRLKRRFLEFMWPGILILIRFSWKVWEKLNLKFLLTIWMDAWIVKNSIDGFFFISLIKVNINFDNISRKPVLYW